jgi:hypothetical protein
VKRRACVFHVGPSLPDTLRAATPCKSAVLPICLACLLLAGCYEDSGVTLHQPHVYLGAKDAHAYKQSTHEVELAQRFRKVQTDR